MSSRRSKLPDPKRSGLLGAAICVMLGIFFYLLPTWRGFYLFSYNLSTVLTSRDPPKQAVIVRMDDRSRTSLSVAPGAAWDRRHHASLVRQLTAQNAKVIAIDVLMDDTNQPPEADQALAEAIANHGRVLLAEDVDVQQQQTANFHLREGNSRRPVEALSYARTGVVNFPEDDGVVRRHWWSRVFTNSFAGVAAELSGSPPPKQTRQRWIRYYGPPGTIENTAFIDALSNNVPAGFFHDRTVFVGKVPLIDNAGTSEDAHPTPQGNIPGVEIQATAFLNLINQDWLNELPQWMLFGLLLTVGGVAGGGFVYLRPWVAARWAAAGIVGFTALGFLLPLMFKYWFPWLIVVVVQIPTALVWSVISNSRRLYAEKLLLEETLATARSAIHPSPAGLGPFNPGTQTQVLAADGAAADAPTLVTPAIAGPVIPDMTLIRNIGQGAYGEVWLGRDILGTYKAVKIVYRDRFSNPAPFDREFRGLQKFTPISRSHPGFVHILHVGRNEPAGYFYAIMEVGDDETAAQQINPQTYVPRNLSKEVRRRGKIPVNECLELSLALADALDYLHKQRLIHRDIKPSNIIFVNGQPKFADIGLVTDLAERGGEVTYLGTEGFIAPEGPGTAAADVYSLGKVMYEASMGRDRDFFPELPTTLIERPDRRELLQLNDIILKACEVEVDQRYQNAGDLKTDLLALQTRIAQGHQGGRVS